MWLPIFHPLVRIIICLGISAIPYTIALSTTRLERNVFSKNPPPPSLLYFAFHFHSTMTSLFSTHASRSSRGFCSPPLRVRPQQLSQGAAKTRDVSSIHIPGNSLLGVVYSPRHVHRFHVRSLPENLISLARLNDGVTSSLPPGPGCSE